MAAPSAQAPQGGGDTGLPYIGSLISLISKSDIRYEGILYTIDMKDSTIALQNGAPMPPARSTLGCLPCLARRDASNNYTRGPLAVRSFGSEGRRTDGPQVPPNNEVFDYIIFRGALLRRFLACALAHRAACSFFLRLCCGADRSLGTTAGSDIRDLTVLTNGPSPAADPAIVSSVRNAQPTPLLVVLGGCACCAARRPQAAARASRWKQAALLRSWCAQALTGGKHVVRHAQGAGGPPPLGGPPPPQVSTASLQRDQRLYVGDWRAIAHVAYAGCRASAFRCRDAAIQLCCGRPVSRARGASLAL